MPRFIPSALCTGKAESVAIARQMPRSSETRKSQIRSTNKSK